MGDAYAGPIIDAHHHIWDPATGAYPWLRPGVLVEHRYGDYTAIKHRYMPEDLRRDAAGQGLVATVYMEAEWRPDDPIGETRYVSGIARTAGLPNAIAAQAWLDRDDVGDVLAQQASFPLVRSVRHKPGTGAATLMSDPAWRRGYALLENWGLHFELQTSWWNLPEAARLAADFPATLLIVNHTGVPGDRTPETLSGWRSGMAALARQPNVAVKISGLGLPGRVWRTEDHAWVIRETIALFGPDRAMFGSNFPVDRMMASYADIFATFRAVTADLAPLDQRRLFHDTALRIYRPVVAPGTLAGDTGGVEL
ncbi:MAG: amidohydrolase family protein [Acetobacteraceae bacterium]